MCPVKTEVWQSGLCMHEDRSEWQTRTRKKDLHVWRWYCGIASGYVAGRLACTCKMFEGEACEVLSSVVAWTTVEYGMVEESE
jgi:hypothetical protein